MRRISQLAGAEQGRRAFVLANGPSIAEEDLAPLKDELVIGMNASPILDRQFGFESKYYVVSDVRFLTAPTKRRWATTALPQHTTRILRSELRGFDDPALEARTYYVPALTRDGFSANLANGYHYACTTTMLALQLAWYLGVETVYVLGCDLRYPPESPRFYEEGGAPQLEDAFTSVQLLNITQAAQHFEAAGRRVVNCSAGSFLRPYLEFQTFRDVLSRRSEP